MRITSKRLDVFKKMVEGSDGKLRSPDLFEAAFLEKDFSQTNMLNLLGWNKKVYENKRKSLQNHLTLRHLKRIANLLSMDLKDVVELVDKNAPINQMSQQEAEVVLSKHHYKIRDVQW